MSQLRLVIPTKQADTKDAHKDSGRSDPYKNSPLFLFCSVFVEDVEVIFGFSYTYLIILLNHIIFYIFYKKE